MKINYTLILLKDRNILVSDENISHEELYIDDTNSIRRSIGGDGEYWRARNNYKKVIAGIDNLPSLTYSDEVKGTLKDKFGWVDMEEFIDNQYKNYKLHPFEAMYPIKGATKRFCIDLIKAHQSITNKMFSLEDIKKAWKYDRTSWEGFFQSLQQPKHIKVEVEMEDYVRGCDFGDLDAPTLCRPKVSNNSITITKIL